MEDRWQDTSIQYMDVQTSNAEYDGMELCDRWMDKRTNEWTDGQMEGLTNEQMKGWTN